MNGEESPPKLSFLLEMPRAGARGASFIWKAHVRPSGPVMWFAVEEGFVGGGKGALGSRSNEAFQGNVEFSVKAADHFKR